MTWRVNDRLTLCNLGLRYDLMTGYQIDQSKGSQFRRASSRRARVGVSTASSAFEDFGKDPREDKNNIQPRLGAVWNVNGLGPGRAARRLGHLHGRWLHELQYPVWRGGCHRDSGSVRSSRRVIRTDCRNPDGCFFRVGQPLSNLASFNEATPGAVPLFGFGPISPQAGTARILADSAG